jgi:tRNA(His) guanylyltransferase
MAHSTWEYVKDFERLDPILPQVYILVRIDGKGFHRYRSTFFFFWKAQSLMQ